MIASAASFGSPNLMQGAKTRAARPSAAAPKFRDRRQGRRAEHAIAAVVLAPAAMSALIEAQERQAQDASPMEIDQLCSRFDEASAPLAALFQGPVDFQT